jgi:tetratricopeptide (TPR) repeat protein
MSDTETVSGEVNALPEDVPEGAMLHLGIAEQGKLYALDGDHPAALFYYRKAMQMSIAAGDPEVFFRHYLDCVMESLEHIGSYAEIVEYCEKALKIYEENPPQNELTLRDKAHLYEKLGVAKLKSGDVKAARRAFEDGLKVLAGSGQVMPLARSLERWLAQGLYIDVQRVLTEQERCHYFTVRPDSVDPARAVKLPDEMVQRGLHAGAFKTGVHHG